MFRIELSDRSITRYCEAAGLPTSRPAARNYIPQLRLRAISVDLWTDRKHIGRYATGEVSAVSKVETVESQGWVEVLPSGPHLPLHWAGTGLTPDEASAPRLTINPTKPARLDVAFALPPLGKGVARPITEGALMSSQVSVMISGDNVKYVPTEPWTGQGCWLAQPAALYNPDPRSEAYLPPGEYRIRVSVECSSGEGDSQEFTLVSPTSWEGLQLRPT